MERLNKVYLFGRWIFRLLGKYGYAYRVVHPERIIEEGSALIASNHCSFLDPPMVGIAFDNEMHFLARKTLFRHPFFRWLYTNWYAVPIDQENPDIRTLRGIINLLRNGKRVIIFPEGVRSPDGKLGAAQPGTGFIIAKSRAPVLPVRLFGTHEALPRGGKKLQRSRITLVVGEKIDFSEEIQGHKGRKGKKELYQRLSDLTMEAIAKLELPEALDEE